MKIMDERKPYSFLHSNKGSTLITVIVAIAFVTILTTIILGTTVVNVRMKGIDRRTHEDFYYAERSLNDLYTGLGQELAELAGEQYEVAFKKLGDGTGDYSKAEIAENAFKKSFVEKAYDHIDELDGSKNGKVTKGALNEYIIDESKGKVENDTDIVIEYQDKNGKKTTVVAERYRVALKSVEVSVKDSSGYRSTVTTDIIINVPTVDFLGTNVDVSDYGLIANEGLYILGGDCNITGNVYAGTHDTNKTVFTKKNIEGETIFTVKDSDFEEITDKNARESVYGGINIQNAKASFNSNYIVSKGDINLVGKIESPELIVNESSPNLANLWFTSLRTLSGSNSVSEGTTIKPKIILNANTFALDNLALNANNSNVKIKGNYYGYNDKTKPALGQKAGRDDNSSSAIIINGNKVTLDMEEIKNFVLMGKAYIDFTSDSQTKSSEMDAKNQIVETAEGVALKTNQQLYLVPPDFLVEANPYVGATEPNFTLSVSSTDYGKWFGHKYLRDYKLPYNSDDARNDTYTHTKHTVILNDGTKVYYDYLNFDEMKSWVPVKNAEGKITGYKANLKDGCTDEDDPENYNVIGTKGSVSSKAAFFYEIMNSTTYDAAVEATAIQPSAYRLNQRVKSSMENSDYFDLKKCVIGKNAADANYYAKNAVVNYVRDDSEHIQSNVFSNTVGMDRYIGYTQNLYYRYVWLCTRLDGKEEILLDGELEEPDLTEWEINTSSPMSHFVILPTNEMELDLSALYANDAGLKPGAYGACIATKKDNLTIGSGLTSGLVGNTFKGVAIVDGNITVEQNYSVDGLLMATGTITLEGNNNINYNKGLIQSRIEKELNIIKSTDPSVTPTPIPGASDDDPKDYYLINYLGEEDPESLTHALIPMYTAEKGAKIRSDRIEADYNEFMHYENWQKGEQ